jgi:hypothetical protein
MNARKAISLVMLLAAAHVGGARASDFAILPTRAAPPPPSGPPAVVNAPPLPPAPPLAAPPPPAAPYGGSPLSAEPAQPADASGHFFADVNYLISWLGTGHAPLLVTTSPGNLPRGQAGVEGFPGNAALFGNDGIAKQTRPGMLLRVGYQLDDRCRDAFEVGVLVIGRDGDNFNAASNGTPVLARPFFNTQTNASDADLVAFPGLLAGTVHVRTASDLIGTEVNYRCALACLSCGCDCDGGSCAAAGPGDCTVDFLIGYRSMRYRDKIVIDTTRRNLDPANVVSNRPLVEDSFYGRTLFDGGQIGLEARTERENFFLLARGTAALGMNNSRTDVNGFSDVVSNGVTTQQRVGLLTGRTNIAFYQAADTGFVSEMTLRAGYRLGQHLTFSVGYTGLFFSGVMKSAPLIDRFVNTTQIPPATLTGPDRPALIQHDTNTWAHAVSLGLAWNY